MDDMKIVTKHEFSVTEDIPLTKHQMTEKFTGKSSPPAIIISLSKQLSSTPTNLTDLLVCEN
jgi:hypothetical protein